jgi:hypothetical protein
MSAPQCEPEKEYEPVAVQLRIIEVGVNDCTFAATELGFPPTIEFGKAQAMGTQQKGVANGTMSPR